jgi:hypothetical protein
MYCNEGTPKKHQACVVDKHFQINSKKQAEF